MPITCSPPMSFRVFGGLALLAGLLIGRGAYAAPPGGDSPDAATLPKGVDLRPALETWGLGPRVQGKRNTCSVFTVAGALEYALAAKNGHGTRLSVEFLNWASNRAVRETVDGGFFSDLWRGLTVYGTCPEEDLPYQAEFDPRLKPSEQARDHARLLHELGLRLHWIKRWNPHTGLTDEQLVAIKRVLNRQWPVCGGFRWPKKPVKWDNDVLEMPPPEGVYDGHSVLIVGYRDDPGKPGGGVFLFRNSSQDGRDGYMTYQYARAYMNDGAWIDYEQDDGLLGARGSLSSSKLSTRVAGVDGHRREALVGEPPDRRISGGGLAPDPGHPRRNHLNLELLSLPVPASGAASWREPLGPLSFFPEGRNRRVSSNQQPDWHNENLDMNWLMPGQSVKMPLLEGPGVITHIWFTSHSGWVGELNSLSLRIYYDDNQEPGVEVPLGDFFAVGHGRPAVVNSIPVQVSPTGSLTCYWRMPFRNNARIVVTNDNPDRSTGLYWQVDWVQLEELPAETPYFYARYRQQYPAAPSRDYLLADLKGSGYYVGTVMSVTLAQDGWFGEGDDFFYIDGEEVPSLQGTGSEDYFNDAWGFRPRTSPWFGQPRWQGDKAGQSGVCYRWHLPDPVRFSQSLKVAIEHRGNREESEDGFFLERPDFISSVAYWYQAGRPRTTFPPLPSWPQRRVPWQHHHLVKAYRHAKTSGKAKVKVQTQGFFGARPVLEWPNQQPGTVLTLPFELREDGRYAVRLTAANGPGCGTFGVELDGRKVVAADFRAPEDAEADLALGTHELKKGEHTLSFRASENAQRVGSLAVEILRLLKLPPEAQRTERTHHEAHFIRLGIGRALYAYRLAFETLPDSLETLVEKGFMPARYLRDENNLPLKCWRDGDAMVVESPGKDHWKHSWQGLDPRR